MATAEDKVSHLEARVDDLTRLITALDQKIDRRFDDLEGRMEARFTAVEVRFTAVENRIGGVEARSNQLFLSIIGLQVMTLLAIVAGLFGIITRLI